MNNTRQRTSDDDTATRALRIVLQQNDLSHRTEVCEALQQQATSKDFALSRPGVAGVQSWTAVKPKHMLVATLTTGRAPRLARRLAKALVSVDYATTNGGDQSFSAIWAAQYISTAGAYGAPPLERPSSAATRTIATRSAGM